MAEQVPPESVRTVQDGHGLRSCCWRRVIPLESARLSLDSQPLRISFASVVFDEVPQPPRDRGEGRRIGLACVIGAIFPGVCPADRAAARHRLPEEFIVGEPDESIRVRWYTQSDSSMMSERASPTTRTLACAHSRRSRQPDQASLRRTSQRRLPPLRPSVRRTRSNPCASNRPTVPTYAAVWSTRSPSGSTG